MTRPQGAALPARQQEDTMIAPATATTIADEKIEEAIEDAFQAKPAAWITSPRLALGDFAGWWTFGVMGKLCRLHPDHDEGCDGPSCRHAAPWEQAWSDEYARASHSLEAEVEALARRRLRDLVVRFLTEHPEARRT